MPIRKPGESDALTGDPESTAPRRRPCLPPAVDSGLVADPGTRLCPGALCVKDGWYVEAGGEPGGRRLPEDRRSAAVASPGDPARGDEFCGA